ncbi:MAG: ribulose-phosphate 3-epimerase [Verrucomicrobiota bacterium]
MPERILIAPSILAADFSRLACEIAAVEKAGADWIHCDIMDGHFVDNISFGPAVVKAVRTLTTLPLDVHLMIEHPDHYVPRFVEAGANSITVHLEPESKHDVAATLQQIRAAGCRAGLTLNPDTPFEQIVPYLPSLDVLLIMTVHPGFGGQPFRDEQLDKVRRAQEWKKTNDSSLDLEVDGGIKLETAGLAVAAGANVLVAGTAIFKAADYAAEIRALRGEPAPSS